LPVDGASPFQAGWIKGYVRTFPDRGVLVWANQKDALYYKELLKAEVANGRVSIIPLENDAQRTIVGHELNVPALHAALGRELTEAERQNILISIPPGVAAPADEDVQLLEQLGIEWLLMDTWENATYFPQGSLLTSPLLAARRTKIAA